ncbi:MAG: hypothetical protein LAO76_01430 [Acidobacteriia bacterium]|nr:hypothetical protein [Terriglobia bacterium]
MKPILQKSLNDCGLACLAMIAAHHSLPFDYEALVELAPADVWSRGLSMRVLRDLGEQMGMAVEAVRCPAKQVKTLPLPVIVHTTDNHYLLVEKVVSGGWMIVDPRYGRGRLSTEEFAGMYSELCLCFSPVGPLWAGSRVEYRRADAWVHEIRKVFLRWAMVLLALGALHVGLLVIGFAVGAAFLPRTALAAWGLLVPLFGAEALFLGRATQPLALRAYAVNIRQIVELCSPRVWLQEIPGGYQLRERVRWMGEQLYQSRAPLFNMAAFFCGAAATALYGWMTGDTLLGLFTTIIGVAALIAALAGFGGLELSKAESSERRFIEAALKQLSSGDARDLPALRPSGTSELVRNHTVPFVGVVLFSFYWVCAPHPFSAAHLLLAASMQIKLTEWWSGATPAYSSWRIIRHCYEHLECMRLAAKAHHPTPAKN